jgi:hypothetical protein
VSPTRHVNEDETSRDEDAWTNRGPAFRGSVPSLDAFASIQRYLASIDLSAIQAPQRAIERGGMFKQIAEAQDAIARNFARTLD